MLCPNCASDLPDGAVFCGDCGAILGLTAPQFDPPFPPSRPDPPEPEPPASSPPSKRAPAKASKAADIARKLRALFDAALEKTKGLDRRKLTVFCVCAVVGVVALAVLIGALAGGGAKGAAKKWLTAHYTYDYTTAIKYEYIDAERWLDENRENFKDAYDTANAGKFVRDFQKGADSYAAALLGENIAVAKLEIRDVLPLSGQQREAYIANELEKAEYMLAFRLSKINKIVKVFYTVEASGAAGDETARGSVYFARAGGKWYALESSLSMADRMKDQGARNLNPEPKD